MKKLLFITIAALFVLLGCNNEEPEDGKDGIDGIDYYTNDSTDDTRTSPVYNPNGYAIGGPFLKGGIAWIQTIKSNGKAEDVFRGEVTKNDGYFDIPAEISTDYGIYYIKGNAFNELSTGFDDLEVSAYVKMVDDCRIVSSLSSVKQQVIKYYYENGATVGDIDASRAAAQTDTLNYFGFTSSKLIECMDIVGETKDDAILPLSNSAIIQDENGNYRDGPEQIDFIQQVANGIIYGDTALSNTIKSVISNLPLKKIRDNLNNRYTEIGSSSDCAPIWLWSEHEYYSDLLTRTPTVLESFMNGSSTCFFDTDGYNSFAYPIVFTNIESLAKYIATELDNDGNYSIWSAGTYNQGVDYLGPLAQLVTIEQLNEILLEPALSYNGFLGEHGLLNGTQYFIVQNFDDLTHRPGHTCDGDMTQFGRNLAAVDNNWGAAIGFDNLWSWGRRQPKIFITD